MEVSDINQAIEALKGSDVIQGLHDTPYGAKEVVAREPTGHFVIFFAVACEMRNVAKGRVLNMHIEERRLKDLTSVGPAILKDFALLGIKSVAELRRRSPQRMYDQLCCLKQQRLDPCCLDVFVAAVAQAQDPNLPIEQRQWWYWSKVRKRQSASASA